MTCLCDVANVNIMYVSRFIDLGQQLYIMIDKNRVGNSVQRLCMDKGPVAAAYFGCTCYLWCISGSVGKFVLGTLATWTCFRIVVIVSFKGEL